MTLEKLMGQIDFSKTYIFIGFTNYIILLLYILYYIILY